MQKVQKKEGKMKRIGTAKVVNGILIIRFEKAEKKLGKHIPKGVKETLEGIVFGRLIFLMLLIAVEANACGAAAGIHNLL